VAGQKNGCEAGGTQVVAYRVESRKTNKDSAAGILYVKRVSVAVRTVVEDYESKH
jgi:hypothetical protein